MKNLTINFIISLTFIIDYFQLQLILQIQKTHVRMKDNYQIIVLFALILSAVASVSSFDPSSIPQYTFTVTIAAGQRVLDSRNITVLESWEYFKSYQDKISYEVEIPTNIIEDVQMRVKLSSDDGKQISLQKKWTLVTNKCVNRNYYGLDSIFGVSNWLNIHCPKVAKHATNKLYLMLHSNDSNYQQDNSLKAGSTLPQFVINQFLIQRYSQWINVQELGQSFKVKVIPFMFAFKYFNVLSSYLFTLNQFQKVFLNDMKQQQLKDHLSLYFQKIFPILKKYPFIHQYIEYYQQPQNKQYKQEMLNQLQNYSDLLHEPLYSGEMIKVFIKIILFVLEQFKQLIFFDQNQNRMYLWLAILLSINLQFILIIIWVFSYFKLYSKYKDHIGLSFVVCYTALFIIIIKFLNNYLTLEAWIIGIVAVSIIIFIRCQRTDSFPYLKLKTQKNYAIYARCDDFILIIECLAIFVLYIGSYIFHYKIYHLTNPDNSSMILIPSVLQQLNNLFYEYWLFFALMAQCYINYKLKSVAHLTYWFVAITVLLCLSDDLIIFVYSDFFYVLLRLKEDFICAFMLWQIIQYNNIGAETRFHFLKLEVSQLIEKRNKQFQQLNILQNRRTQNQAKLEIAKQNQGLNNENDEQQRQAERQKID